MEYKDRKKLKKCKHCDNVFLATDKQVSCSKECTRKAKLDGMTKHVHIVQCNTCGKIISTKIKYGSLSKDILRYKRCSECCKKRRTDLAKQRYKEKLKLKIENNPTDFYERILRNGRKIIQSKSKEKNTKTRMIKNNPMKKNEVKEKVRNTRIENIIAGTLKYKKGKEHHLWKGNRSNNNTIRTRLLKWRKEIHRIKNWKCEICGSNKNLEVHHLEPLREIIDKFTNKPLSKYLQESEEFENLCEIILNYHNEHLEIGQLLCAKCHSTVDICRKQTYQRNADTAN